jgi:hypothetical protein
MQGQRARLSFRAKLDFLLFHDANSTTNSNLPRL